MDPLAALNLASIVVQLVDFGIQTAAKGRQIYKDGATIEQQDYMTTMQELSTLSESLQKSIQGTAQTALTREDEELRVLALKCHDQTGELHSELLKLSITEEGRVRSVLSKTIKSTIRSGKINDIRNKLLGIQKVLDSKILVRLYDQAKQVAFHQEERYERLDGDLQYFITQLANGFHRSENLIRREAADTRAHVSAKHTETRRYVASEIDQARGQLTTTMQSLHIRDATAERRNAFIHSLVFPEIHFRQENIADAHRDTFEWIFDESGQRLRPWSSFVDWLKCSDSLYWVNGKLGSGKSTLMNFIYSDPRTKEYLSKGQRTAKVEPLIVRFFFWNAGNPMQKSTRGLLQSLLYQLLTQEEDLYDNLVKTDPTLQSRHLHLVWSPKMLKNLLAAAIGVLSRPLCIFLDGLDEFDEDENELLGIIKVFRSRAGVKICVSSRPSQSYEENFRGCPRLKLQDLTSKSIKIYLRGTLLKSLRDQKFPHAKPGQSSKLINLILEKAEGVFLWVEVVAKQIVQGLIRRDSWEILLKRVDSLPSNIENIYQRMWNRYQDDLKIYADKAHIYFRLVLVEEISLLQFTIATNPDLQQKYLQDDVSVNEAEIMDRCEDTEIYITTRCAGLLETSKVAVQPRGWNGPFSASRNDDNNSIAKLGLKWRVQFIHRTARDFVSDCLSIESACEQVSSNSEVGGAIVRSRCAIWQLDTDAKKSIRPRRELQYIEQITNITGPIQEDLWVTVEEMFISLMKLSKDKDIRRTFGVTHVAVDFLGTAVEMGQLEVVGKYLSTTQDSDPDYLTYILSCAVNGPVWESGTLSLICQVVKAGARTKTAPDWLDRKYKKLGSRVVSWHQFLVSLWRHSWITRIECPELQKAVSMFLETGVDLDQTISLKIPLTEEEPRDEFSATKTFRLNKLILRTNAASMLRRMFGDEHWFASLKSMFGLENQAELFEAVLVYDSRGSWYCVSGSKDSTLLVEMIEKLWAAREEHEHFRDPPFSVTTEFDDHNILNPDPPEWTELVRRKAEVVRKSAAVGWETNLQEVQLPGWTAQTTREMLQFLGNRFHSDEKIVERYEIPKRLLEGLGADSGLIDYAPESWPAYPGMLESEDEHDESEEDEVDKDDANEDSI